MASVVYRISGKNDDRAIREAQRGLKGLGDQAKNLNNIFKAFVAFKGLQQLKRVADDTMKSFSTQQQAIARLTQSINNNANMSSKSLQNIIKLTGQMQKRSIFGDETLQEQAAFLSNLGMTEDKIKDVLQAAIDLSSSGYGSLESNVKALSQTLNGQAGSLGRVIPGLKELTKEQLEAGEAIEIVRKQYEGFGEAMLDTLEGKEKSFGNIIGDIKENIGAIFAVFRSSFLDNAIPVLNSFNEWFSNNLPQIINGIINIPEIAGIVFNEVKKYLKELFEPENFSKAISSVWQFMLDQGTTVLNLLTTVAREVGGFIWEPLKFGFEMIVYGIKSLWQGLVTAIVKGVNLMLTPINALLGGLVDIVNTTSDAAAAVQAFIQHPFSRENRERKRDEIIAGNDRISAPNLRVNDPVFDALERPVLAMTNLGTRIKTVVDGFKTATDESRDNLKALGSELWDNGFGDSFESTQRQITEVLNRELPDSVKRVLEPVALAMQEAADHMAEQSGGTMDTGLGMGKFMEVLDTIVTGIGSFIGAIGGAIQGLTSVQMILDPLGTILNGMMMVLQPVIDSLLRPLIGILTIVGQFLGHVLAPILQRLEPIIAAVTVAFTWLYNYAIRPFGNAIIWLVSQINNAIANVLNGIINLINKIPGVRIRWSMGKMDYDTLALEKIGVDDVVNAGSTAMGSAQSAGASYSGVRDVTVNIYYNHSYVNGSAREIALNIKNELELAGALGY